MPGGPHPAADHVERGGPRRPAPRAFRRIASRAATVRSVSPMAHVRRPRRAARRRRATAATACASVQREKFKPLGGPDGGNGGRGGDVVLRRRPAGHDAARLPPPPAPQGDQRQARRRVTSATAPTAPTSCCRCPRAPSSRTATATVLADLVGAGRRVRRRPGGRGGLGNKALRQPARKAPGFALLGEPGEALDVVLELKSVADVALIGFPSAGKSSLDRRRCPRPGRRSPTTRSRRSSPTSAWSQAGERASPSPTCPG